MAMTVPRAGLSSQSIAARSTRHLAKLDDAKQCLEMCRKLGIPAEAGEQGEQANRAFLESARQTFFPYQP
jgi:hypothetical protein